MVRDFPLLPGFAARGYEQPPPLPGLVDVTDMNYSAYIGSGSMISNADDVNRFYTALFAGGLLRPATLAAMKTTVPTGGSGQASLLRYGLGLMRLSMDAVCPGAAPAYGHGGDLPGFGSWSLHAEDGSRHISSTMTRDATASAQAQDARLTLAATEFCGHRPSAEPRSLSALSAAARETALRR